MPTAEAPALRERTSPEQCQAQSAQVEALAADALARSRVEVEAGRRTWEAARRQREALVGRDARAILSASEELERSAARLAEAAKARERAWRRLLQEVGAAECGRPVPLGALREALAPEQRRVWDELMREGRRVQARLAAALGENERTVGDALAYCALCLQILADGHSEDYQGPGGSSEGGRDHPRRPLFVDRAV